MTREEILKKEILEQYSSVRKFCIKAEIPYSTLSTALDRGIDNMSFSTVLKMCTMLSINPIDFSSMDNPNNISEKFLGNALLGSYLRLNKEGRKRALEYIDDLGHISKYLASNN